MGGKRSERDVGDVIKGGIGVAGQRVQAGLLDPKPDIADAEEVVTVGGLGGAGVLAGAEQKVKGKGSAHCHSRKRGVQGGRRGKIQRKLDKFDRNAADAGGGWVALGPGAEKSRKAEVGGAVDIQARVWGPQAGKRLAHRS